MELNKRNIERLRQFENRVQTIVVKLKKGNKLSRPDKEWLSRQRLKYEGRVQPPLIAKNVELLDSIIPLLGYDWKNLRKDKTPFLVKLEQIKNKLKNNKKLSLKDREWIRYRSKAFRKNPSSFSKKEISALDSLNPYLKHDWKEPYGRMRFDEFVTHIERLIQHKEPLTEEDKKKLYRRRYLSIHKSKLSKKEIKKLDQLIKILGYDWKEKTPDYAFVERLKMITELLENNKPPTNSLKTWLREQRAKYRFPEKREPWFTKEKIKQLDALIPLLGYDWKQPNPIPYFQIQLDRIYESIDKGEKLDNNQKAWLRKQFKRYYDVESRNRWLTSENIQQLENLIPKLNFESGGSKISNQFKNRVKDIRETLQNQKELDYSQKSWLKIQRQNYMNPDRRKKSLNPEKIELLDSLIPLLGYNWKEYRFPNRVRISKKK